MTIGAPFTGSQTVVALEKRGPAVVARRRFQEVSAASRSTRARRHKKEGRYRSVTIGGGPLTCIEMQACTSLAAYTDACHKVGVGVGSPQLLSQLDITLRDVVNERRERGQKTL